MMKKSLKSLSLILLITLLPGLFTGCARSKKSIGKTQTVTLNEVARSVFYAPMYVAINEGFMKKQGLTIDLTTGQGADANITSKQVFCNAFHNLF